MKIMVTGGAGFIGSNIVDALYTLGHEICVVDNLLTGNRRNINEYVNFNEIDINSHEIGLLFEQFKPEIVIHHAAQVSVGRSSEIPILDQEINIGGTLNILQNCVKNDVRKIIYASSAAVYGTPHYLPVNEKHPIAPESFYGISKYTPETYIQTYSKLYGLDYTILRYSNVYGPRQDHRGEGGVISIFINNVLNGITPVVFGDGQQTRDFIFVEDVVKANIAAINTGSRNIFNISTNQSISILGLLDGIGGSQGGIIVPTLRDARIGDIQHSRLDNAKAVKDLKWWPSTDLREGLKLTFEFYEKTIEKVIV